MSSVKFITLGATASLSYRPQFLSTDNTSALLKKWTTELKWEQSKITLFGKTQAVPRLNAWYGDEPYAYSGVRFAANPLTPELADLKTRVEKISNLQFNSVLLNWYRHGQDSMGWHSDDEKCLGDAPQIASISLGDQRRFILREKANHANKVEIPLQDGSLLLMLGETQSLWQHSLPKTRKHKENRVNLTFRLIEQSF